MDHNSIIQCAGFYFIHNFDSGNLGHVERVATELIVPSVNPKTNSVETPDFEFNLWTRPDCAGTEFENGNRTWFYFGVQASEPNLVVRLNLINLNKQGKMYNQGMAPVTRTLPGKPQWERIRDRPVHSTDDNTFTLSFKYRTAENTKATTFFAFTYPFSFAELQIALNSIDLKMLPMPTPQHPDDIYYCRECLVYSLEGRRVDLLTITSHHGITNEREERLKNLFPENQERPFKFQNKKIIFVSARVHPGETPSSFVFNGFLNLLLTRTDPVGAQLRRLYVFKMIPFLNPDGVARGHYRTDTRGVNLNRVYLSPSLALHPTVYASRALIRYYHYGCEREDNCEDSKSFTSRSIQNISESSEVQIMEPRRSRTNRLEKTDSKEEKGEKKKAASRGDARAPSLRTALLEQVTDMKIEEEPYQHSDSSSRASACNLPESPSLLTDDNLRSCLGSGVHLSTSEELNVHGPNPLKPLRETLKNSISLLIGSNPALAGEPLEERESCASSVKVGWCGACRRAAARLEHALPGLAAMLPAYTAHAAHTAHSSTLLAEKSRAGASYRSIEEYREHQRLQYDEKHSHEHCDEPKNPSQSQSADTDDSVYLCTNCFKRYTLSDTNEEVTVSGAGCGAESAGGAGGAGGGVTCTAGGAGSVLSAVSGDSGDAPRDLASATSDTRPTTPLPAQKSEDKPKSPGKGTVKKKPSYPTGGAAGQQNKPAPPAQQPPKEPDSGLFLYIDLHGHASKKGIFMYGNHFEDIDRSVECMLLPRIMSLNNLHFHFTSCNFTERNMYLKDRRDGMSREGSGRVAVLKATGLVRSYTLECNYNTGRLVNVLPPAVRESAAPHAPPPAAPGSPPPKYTPHIYEEVNPFQGRHFSRGRNLDFFEEIDAKEVGRSLGASILDLTGHHPNSRIPGSEHRNLASVRDWLRAHTRTLRPQLTMSRLRPKPLSPPRAPLYARSKTKPAPEERKENAYAGAKSDAAAGRRSPALAPRSTHDIINMNMKFAKKNEPVKTPSRTRARYLADAEPKPKTLLSTKRRSILAVRKPNAGKAAAGGAPTGGVVKAKTSRRSVDDADDARGSLVSSKLSKRSFGRARANGPRGSANRCRAMASSSSSDALGAAWEDVSGGTALADALAGKRRPFPNPSPSRLKKIRLKTGL